MSSLYIRPSNWMEELKSFTKVSVSFWNRPPQSFMVFSLLYLYKYGERREVSPAAFYPCDSGIPQACRPAGKLYYSFP